MICFPPTNSRPHLSSSSRPVPDFRSPNTGLYANLARLNLPHAEAVFDISYFRSNPKPFYVLAKELYPGQFHPTVSHVFIALLAAKGLLSQLFTQNIDCLERRAGVPDDLIVEAHGSFATQRCIECKQPFPDDAMREFVARGDVPRCPPCKGLVKPDIVFFGEALPTAFAAKGHFPRTADLVLVLGTSLMVFPFAGLPDDVPAKTPRVLFNLDKVGSLGSRRDDVLVLGECDEGVRELADALGWREELEGKWRRLVGDEEAERQLRSARSREAGRRTEVDDEVDRIAVDIGENLRLEEAAALEADCKVDHHGDRPAAVQEPSDQISEAGEGGDASQRTIPVAEDLTSPRLVDSTAEVETSAAKSAVTTRETETPAAENIADARTENNTGESLPKASELVVSGSADVPKPVI